MNEQSDSGVKTYRPNLKAYVGTKILLAEPMTETQYLESKGIDPTNRETQGAGYLVQYDNGYISWSPKDVFEIHYRLLTDTEKQVARR
jgi:hypothetical protein